MLGGDSLETLREHAAGYLPAAFRVEDEFLAVDLGTGAGVPGVFLALLRPRSRWLLVDSQKRRCAHAEAAVRAMELGDRVTVRHARAEELAVDPDWRSAADLVVARSFGPPPEVAECGLPLLRPGGRLVVSATEETAAVWQGLPAVIPTAAIDVEVGPSGRFVTVVLAAPIAADLPRRPPARRRHPLF